MTHDMGNPAQGAYDWGLVLEGGGMRGVFTAGVMDALLDYGVMFPYVIGTSAGATSGSIYLARQRGRARFIDIDLQKIHPYVGVRWMLAGKGIINMDFLFNVIPKEYYPFDFHTYSHSPSRLVMVATNALTGEAAYCEEKEDFERFVDISRASCTLPLMCPMWHIDGTPMVDGGVGDSIPFDHALADGCRRVVVVMTKDPSYRKNERSAMRHMPAAGRYKQLALAMRSRNARYNRQVERLLELEKEGRAIVVRPNDMCGVGRTTSDAEKLEALYAEGLRAGRELVEKINMPQSATN